MGAARILPAMASQDEPRCGDPPDTSQQRRIPHARAWNIGFRTAHIAATGILLGGHVFEVLPDRLAWVLYLSILTGGCLLAIEAYPRFRWLHEGCGVMVLAKLALLCVIPLLWEYRVPILLVVIVLGSVGSHMPRRFRYYSLVLRDVS